MDIDWAWAPREQRPVATVRPRYEWLYVYAFVRPATGETYWLLLPTVKAAAFSLALRQFAQAVGAGADKRVALVLDGAGWHGGRAVVVLDGLHRVTLPPYFPGVAACRAPVVVVGCPARQSLLRRPRRPGGRPGRALPRTRRPARHRPRPHSLPLVARHWLRTQAISRIPYQVAGGSPARRWSSRAAGRSRRLLGAR